jgi:predicted DNA-binding transcriptional regulator AlpA
MASGFAVSLIECRLFAAKNVTAMPHASKRPGHTQKRGSRVSAREETLNTEQVFRMLDIGAARLRSLRRLGAFPEPKRIEGRLAWSRSDIEKWLRRNPQLTPSDRPSTFALPRAVQFVTPEGLVAVDAVAQGFGLTKAALADSLGLAEETLQRISRANAPRTQQRLREMLEILSRVEPWAGGMPQALGWYRGQSIAALGYQTAEALVKNDQAGIVRAYLDGLAAGAFA